MSLSFNVLDIIEYIAIIASCGYVIMSARQSIVSWGLGLVGSVLYIIIFYVNRLYGSALLSCIFVVLMAYGWFMWLQGKHETALVVTLLNPMQRLVAVLCAMLLTPLVYFMCMKIIGDTLPVEDAVIAGFSMVAQILVARKKLEAWYAWIAINMLAVYTYGTNHLIATALLYIFYVVLAVYGLITWRRSMSATITEIK